jgi:hypothetical protein
MGSMRPGRAREVQTHLLVVSVSCAASCVTRLARGGSGRERGPYPVVRHGVGVWEWRGGTAKRHAARTARHCLICRCVRVCAAAAAGHARRASWWYRDAVKADWDVQQAGFPGTPLHGPPRSMRAACSPMREHTHRSAATLIVSSWWCGVVADSSRLSPSEK